MALILSFFYTPHFAGKFCKQIHRNSHSPTHVTDSSKYDALRCVLQMPFIIRSVHDENIHIMCFVYVLFHEEKQWRLSSARWMLTDAHIAGILPTPHSSSSDRMHCPGFCIKIDTQCYVSIRIFGAHFHLPMKNCRINWLARPRRQQITHRIDEKSLSFGSSSSTAQCSTM